MRTTLFRLFASVPVVACAALVACGSDPGADSLNGPTDWSHPPPASGSTTPPAPPAPAHDGGAPVADAGFCENAEGSYPATRDTSNVLFLLDRSGSMHIKLSNGTDTRWTATKQGLVDLLSSLPSTTRAGAMMFPQGDQPITCCGIDPVKNDVTCSCATGELPGVMPRCDVTTYGVPVQVATLGGSQVTSIESYVASSDDEFYWGTPLEAGLRAAISKMRASTLDGVKSVVLLTDGYPTSCDTTTDPTANDIERVVEAAAQGAQGAPYVRTFVMGVIDGTKGAKPEYLSQIAKAGGTGRTASCEQTNDCFYALNAATFAQDIKAAFDQIALQAFDCTFTLPPAPAGGQLDLSKVNVKLVTQAGQVPLSLDANHQDGWDYLPGQTKIQLYGSACTQLKSDPKASVDIVAGCTTQSK